MLNSMWQDLFNDYDYILNMISEYNKRIIQGLHLEFDDILEVQVINNCISAHLINVLFDDEVLFLPNNEVISKILQQTLAEDLLEYSEAQSAYKLHSNASQESIIDKLLPRVFNKISVRLIQEGCAQDIVYGGDLIKKLNSFMGAMTVCLQIQAKGEDALFHILSEIRNGRTYKTRIQLKFEYEYRNRGALIRNRVFKHDASGKRIPNDVNFQDNDGKLLDYRVDGNFCQSAVLHIGIESTGSTGTGFMISGNGYALTCAHVVEGAHEVYATIINNDGYPVGERKGFEVYDAGDGEVVYINSLLDIALLKMHHYGDGYLPIEEREILPELGEEVVVFGYPLGYEMPQSNSFGPNISFYRGYVSSNQIRNGNSVTFLDIDVKSGNSGSPVISTKTGKVIGIMSGIKVGGRRVLTEKMPYMIPIQHFIKLMIRQ